MRSDAAPVPMGNERPPSVSENAPVIPLALAAAGLSFPCHAPLCAGPCAFCPAAFHGPYLPAALAVGPNPVPDTLAGAPPYLTASPGSGGFDLPAPTRSDELPAPTPFRFGPTGISPRLGPGPLPPAK